MAGPCVIENETMPFEICQTLISICNKLDIPFIFKASYRKANRSKIDSFQGIGDQKALNVLGQIKQRYNIPIVTDVHSVEEIPQVSEVADIIQIPAFLSRQTDLLVCAAKTNKIINIKKGQFLSGQAMKYACEKVFSIGNKKVILTDRGNMYGYQDLVVDFRNIIQMQENKVPVVMDITHSLQKPNQYQGVSGGDPTMIETIARAAISIGTEGLFIETHPNPQEAKSDGSNMLPLSQIEGLLTKLIVLKEAVCQIDN